MFGSCYVIKEYILLPRYDDFNVAHFFGAEKRDYKQIFHNDFVFV